MKLKVCCLLFFCLFLAGSIQAGALHFSNGDRISGEIVETTDALVTIRTAFGLEMTIGREHVSEIETGESVLEQAAVEQAVIEAASHQVERNWESRIGLNSTFSRGNTDSQLISLQADYKLEQDRNRYEINFSSIREEKEGDKVKEQDRLNLGYNYLYSQRWFFALNSTLEQDPVALLDHRYSLNPAIGYDIWNDADRSLNVQLGAGYSQEQVGGEDESSSLVDWRLNYSQEILDGAMAVFHKHQVYRNLQGRKNVVFNSQSGVRYDLNDHLFLNVQLNYDYDTEPAQGTDSEDLTFMVGAGMTL